MAILEAMEAGHGHVTDLRGELDKVREALDRTDAVLAVTDGALVRAEDAIVTTRKWAPYAAVGLSIVVVGVVAVVVWRRRRHRDEFADA
jgi:hypothetical protein